MNKRHHAVDSHSNKVGCSARAKAPDGVHSMEQSLTVAQWLLQYCNCKPAVLKLVTNFAGSLDTYRSGACLWIVGHA